MLLVLIICNIPILIFNITSILFFRIYAEELRQSQPQIDDAEIDAKLDQEFASWFEKYVSN